MSNAMNQVFNPHPENVETGQVEATEWVPLMDYAMQYNVSMSTLRRHIKTNKIPFRVENGRYLVRSPRIPAITPPTPTPAGSSSEITDLRLRLQRAQEEVSELKMLVAIYEEQLAHQQNPAPAGLPSRPASMRMNG